MDDDGYALRDEQRRRLGQLAQEIVLESERKRLGAANRADLAERVKDVSAEPWRGYEILSFEQDESPRYIEVKAARKSGDNVAFFLSENEWQQSRKLRDHYYFYLVFGARTTKPKVEFLSAQQLSPACLKALDYRVALSTSQPP